MDSSQFMDKQITELSKSPTIDFLDFDSPQEEEEEEEEEDYRRADSKSYASTFRNCNSTGSIDSAKVARGRVGTSHGVSLISEVDSRVKEHSDNLLHAVEALSARLTQLESRVRRLDNSVDNLKESVEFNHGKTEGQLKQLENILREVQGCVQFLQDRQEIAVARLQLAKLQLSKDERQSRNQNNTVQNDLTQEMSSYAPQPSHLPVPIPIAFPQQLPALPPNTPAQPIQNLPPAPAVLAPMWLPTPLSQDRIPYIPQPGSYYPAPTPTSETTCQQFHMPPTQQSQPPPPLPHQPYKLAPQLPQISQLPQLPQLHQPLSRVESQVHTPLGPRPEQSTYTPSQSHSQSIHQSSPLPFGGALTAQQFFAGCNHQVPNQPLSRPYSEFATGSSLPPGHSNFNNLHPGGGSSSHYSCSTMKPVQLSPSRPVQTGGNCYSQLPTAQVLPQALPMASSVGGGSGSDGTGSGGPIDDVVDKVAAMGFQRDLVTATVRKLTENGQSVDLNLVLDKLMNSGEFQPQKGWFGH